MMSRLSVVVCCLSATATAQYDPLGEMCFGSLNELMRLGTCRMNRVECPPATHAALLYSEVFGQDGGCGLDYCCVELPRENEECAFDYDYGAGYSRGYCRDYTTCVAENPSEIGTDVGQFCANGLVCCIHNNLPA